MHTVMVLGGYGFFGERIAAALAQDPGIRALIAGRDAEKARAACARLGVPQENAVGLDARDPALAARLRQAGVGTLIHAAGPFQAQDYAVARAAIEAGCNYVDLADGRRFVCDIESLNEAASARGVTVISGASSVPALSCAVVDRYAGEFSRLDRIAIGIGSGAKTPGLATMRGVFGYCGKPIPRYEHGAWTMTYGWLDLMRYRFADPVGSRLLGSCDVPDLELFPKRYPSVSRVTFHAGFASHIGHLFVWLLANLVKLGVMRSLVPWAPALNAIGRRMEPMVSDKGGMFVEIEGVGHDGEALRKRWSLVAARNHGPHIPCGAAIAIARKFAAGVALPRGAMPCMGLLSVEEYLTPLAHLDVHEVSA
jgi:saccharopine dehydrogenase-like NADP-dependent oxidoreductase